MSLGKTYSILQLFLLPVRPFIFDETYWFVLKSCRRSVFITYTNAALCRKCLFGVVAIGGDVTNLVDGVVVEKELTLALSSIIHCMTVAHANKRRDNR